MDQFSELCQQLRQNKWVRRAAPLVRGVIIYAVYISMQFIIMGMVNSNPTWKDENGFVWSELALKALLTFFILNTVILAFSIYERNAREAFLKAHPLDFDPSEEKTEILSASAFWCESVALWACFLLFSLPSGYDVFFRAVGTFLTVPQWLHKPILSLLFAALSLHLSVKNKLEVRQLWLEMPSKLMKRGKWMSLAQKKKRKYSYWRLTFRLLGYTVLYLLEAYLLTVLLPYLFSVGRILILVIREGWFWSIPIVAAVLFFCYFRAFRRRRRFLKGLRKLCREYGYEIFDLKHPYLSLFWDAKGYTFGIRAKGKTYLCRILAGIRSANKMYLHANGKCTRSFGVHVPVQRIAQAGPFAQIFVRDENEDLELFRVTSTSHYTFEGEGEKILIINPVPKKVYIKEPNQALHEADNGDTVNEYQIFTGNAFLRSLERKEY